MERRTILLLAILLFFIIYFAVRSAINPLLHKFDETTTYDENLELIKLRDIGILNNTELEEIIKLHQNKGVKKKNYEKYHKYIQILGELKEVEYFSECEYLDRLDKLNKYFGN